MGLSDEFWPWLVLAGFGAFHGINPAMGWLFAVALGLYRKSRTVVVLSLFPIAAGHALSIAVVALLALTAGIVVDGQLILLLAGIVLIAWAVYHQLTSHRVRFGIRVGYLELGAWSFLTASSHGAGLMLVPALIPLQQMAGATAHPPTVASSFSLALVAVGLHTLTMLLTTGVISLIVYQWIGLSVLRHVWINLDRLWTLCLIAMGLLLIAGGTVGCPGASQY